MRTQSRDTSPEAERVQIELLRKAGEARRFALARSMSNTVIELSRRAIKERFPEMNEEEVSLYFVELNYGKDLADRMRVRMKKNNESC